MKINLLDLDRNKLELLMDELGYKKYHAKQIYKWIHQKGVIKSEQMTDLSSELRAKLDDITIIEGIECIATNLSEDGTCKFLFSLQPNNAIIETVYIPSQNRSTLCVSTQIGCAMACSFCATGRQGFERNLTFKEIISQIWYVEHYMSKELGTPHRAISNVVMMGMGEPLQNYANVLPTIQVLLDDLAYGLSRRRVTVSTSGMVPFINQLAQDCPVSLAISLHATDDVLRDQLVPLNKKYPIHELLTACKNYTQYAPRDSVMIEYCLMGGVNDSAKQAHALSRLLKKYSLKCKINLIPFNGFLNSGYESPSPQVVHQFAEILMAENFLVTIRRTRGDDINAACGQLAGKVRNRTTLFARQPANFSE